MSKFENPALCCRMRGRRPIPTALHLMRGTFRWDRHGTRIDAPPRRGRDASVDDDDLDPETERRQAELREQLRRIKGG
jgi:hypothetical protein